MDDTPSSSSSSVSSPQQLHFDINGWLTSIEAIADEYDLTHHESASFSSYVSRGHSGSSQSGHSSLFSSQHREGSGSTAKTSLSIGSVGSGASYYAKQLAERSASASASTSASASQSQQRSSAALQSGSQSHESSGYSRGRLLEPPSSDSQLSSSPSRTMLRSPLSKAVDADDDSVKTSIRTSSPAPAPSSSLSPQSAAGPSSERHVMESPGFTGSFDAREGIWTDVARKLKPFGDTLRQDRLRSKLGKTKLTKDTAELLSYSAQRTDDGPALHDAQIEMLRILANMCIDHEENRDICLNSSAPQAAIQTMQHVLDSKLHDFPLNLITLLRMAMGALNNMQLDHAATREVLRQDTTSIETVLRLATDGRIYKVGDWYRPHDPSVDVWEWKRKVSAGSYVTSTAWHLLQDICVTEEAKSTSPATAPTTQQSPSEDEETEKAFDSILQIGPTKAAVYLVHSLEPFAAKAKNRLTAKGPWDAEDVSDLIESDANAVQSASDLIESCALDSKSFRAAALDNDVIENGPCSTHSVLEFLLRFLDLGGPPNAWLVDREDSDELPPKPSDTEGATEAFETFARAKAAIARAIVLIVGEDDNMAVLFEGKATEESDDKKQNWFIETMKDWMQRDSKERDDLVSTAMLAIGNLARKDSHCISLVHEHGLVPSLTAALQPDVDIKVAHAVVCLLKNLSIPPENKAVIGQSNDLFAHLDPYLGRGTDRVQPLQFSAVGLLKHLCSNCLSNALSLTSKGNTLQELLDLLKRTDDVPTRMEGTRALATAVKSLWSAPASSDAASFGKTIVDIGVRGAARRHLVREPVVMALAEMVRGSTKYPVLVNEGVLALTLLATNTDAGVNGPQLVAQCLLRQTPTRRTRSQAGAAAADEAAQELMAARDGDDASKAQDKADDGMDEELPQPQRKTTLDTLASSVTPGLPPIRSGADMVGTVLARRDARMPPHFASNACALVQTLVSGHGSHAGDAEVSIGKDDEDEDKDVADVTMEEAQKKDESQATEETNADTTASTATSKTSVPSASSKISSDPIKTAVKQWLPALEQLSSVGPQETVATAQRTLESAQKFVTAA